MDYLIEEELNAIKKLWDEEKNSALEESDLNKSKTRAIDAIADLKVNVDSILSDPGKLSDLADSEIARAKEAAYNEKLKTVRLKLEELYNLISDEGAKREQQLKAIESSASDDFAVATEQLAALQTTLEGRIEKVGRQKTNFLPNITEAYQRAKDAVASARAQLIRKKTSGFEAYFDNLDQELDELKDSFSDSSNVGNLTAGCNAFDDILKLMRTVVADAQNGVGPTFANVLTTLEETLSQLGESVVGECKPAAQQGLQEEAKALQGTIKTQNPAQAEAAVDAFKTKVEELAQLAQNAKLYREHIIKPNIKTAEKKIKGLKKLLPNLEYTNSLTARLEGIKGKGQEENKEEEANSKIAELLLEIGRAIDDPEFREAEDIQAREARQKLVEDEQEWNTKRKIFKDTLKRVREAMNRADEADETMWDELKSMLKEADNLAKDQAFEQAISKLALASERAEKVIRNPQGEKVTSRNNLRKDLTRYHNAVNSYVQSIESIATIIKDSETELNEQARTAAVNLLNKMAFEFERSIFDKGVALLSSKDAKVDSKRAAREDALRTVRMYQERLDKGPLMLKVLLAPFEAGQFPAFDSIRLSLNSLDVNVRRCV